MIEFNKHFKGISLHKDSPIETFCLWLVTDKIFKSLVEASTRSCSPINLNVPTPTDFLCFVVDLPIVLGFFANAKNWHHCHLSIPRHLQLSALFEPYDVSNVKLDISGYIQGCKSRLQTSLALLISGNKAKTKFAILPFLYCGNL